MKKNVLSASPLFTGISQEDCEDIYALMQDKTLAKGKALFEAGDESNDFFVILKGKIKLVSSTEDGRENLVSVIGSKEFLGEVALFDPRPVTVSAITLTSIRYCTIKYGDLRKVLDKYPRVAQNMLKILANRLRKTDESLSDFVFYDVPGRVAKSLLHLADSFGEPMPEEGIYVPHDLTQEELSQLVGASRETVNRALADFANRGWIKLGIRAVTILNEEKLRHRTR